MPRTPRDTVKVRTAKLPAKGTEITLRAVVTRTGRNGFDTGETVTVRIPGYPTPLTIDAEYLLESED